MLNRRGIKGSFFLANVNFEDRRIFKRTFLLDKLNIRSIALDFTSVFLTFVLKSGEGCEAPFVWNHDFLSSWEFIFGSSESLNSFLDAVFSDSNWVKDGTDFNSSNLTIGLSEGSSHTGLETISSSTWKHLVDTKTMPGVDSTSHVEVFLANVLSEILVGSDTGGFESFRRNLFDFIRNDVHNIGEHVHIAFLLSNIVDSDLRIWNTSIVARFRIGFASTTPVATSWSSTHLYSHKNITN